MTGEAFSSTRPKLSVKKLGRIPSCDITGPRSQANKHISLPPSPSTPAFLQIPDKSSPSRGLALCGNVLASSAPSPPVKRALLQPPKRGRVPAGALVSCSSNSRSCAHSVGQTYLEESVVAVLAAQPRMAPGKPGSPVLARSRQQSPPPLKKKLGQSGLLLRLQPALKRRAAPRGGATATNGRLAG